MHDLWMFFYGWLNTPSKYLNLNVFSKQHVFLSDSWASSTNQFEVFKLETFAGDLHLAMTIKRSLGKMSFFMFLQTKISLQNNKLFDFHAWIFFWRLLLCHGSHRNWFVLSNCCNRPGVTGSAEVCKYILLCLVVSIFITIFLSLYNQQSLHWILSSENLKLKTNGFKVMCKVITLDLNMQSIRAK